MVVVSLFKCKLSKNFFSKNALTVTFQSKSSPESENMGDFVLLRPHSTKITPCVEVTDGQLAVCKPDENGRDKEVRETTQFSGLNRSHGIHWGKTYATVMIAARKHASEILTA